MSIHDVSELFAASQIQLIEDGLLSKLLEA
jgi:hypothetical protein